MKTPVLRNAVGMSELHGTFDILPQELRRDLSAGDLAKVCVNFGEGEGVTGERFWVIVTAAEDGRYVGKVDNELTCSESHGLSMGDLISFDDRHIYEVVPRSRFEAWRRGLLEEMEERGYENVTEKPFNENRP